MRPGKRCKGDLPPEAGDGGRIESLPDSLLHHILGFLDARQAVRTCVLSRRWRHLWQSATSLRILGWKLAKAKAFLEYLLLLRAGTPLHTFELWFDAFRRSYRPRVNLWVRHALLCKVQVLKLGCSVTPHNTGFQLDDLPLVSQHLRVLKLVGVVLKNRACDFLSCPSLEHLDIANCVFPCARKISSKSLKFLSFINCGFNQDQSLRTLIYAPNLISLRLDEQRCLDGYLYRTPVLDSMPSLQNAFVRLTRITPDCCTHAKSGNCGRDDCRFCYGVEDNFSVLLEGLSETKNLSLIAESQTFIFKRDLKQCPKFFKLKTLLLNDYWCVAPDFHELNCMLKYSPVLERLTLQLFSKGPKHKLRIKGNWNPAEISAAISDHLKIVEVKCEVIDDKVIKVLKFMSTFNIRFILDEVETLED